MEGAGDLEDIDPALVKLGEKIGSGAFGDCFKAMFRGEIVAAKILRVRPGVDPEQQKRLEAQFRKELLVMRTLDHPNIVRFVGATTRPPTYHFLTEYLSGGTLSAYISVKHPIKLQQTVKIGLDIASAMAYLHARRLIHRDLKGPNLLMSDRGDCKVADFGLARVVASVGGDKVEMTAETGTYRWMAPEVISHKPYNHKADVYSYAIVLYEMVAGGPPYQGFPAVQAALAVSKNGLRPTLPEGADPRITAIMKRCWSESPDARPEFTEVTQALAELEGDLSRAVAGRASSGGQQSGVGGFFKRLVRNSQSSASPMG